MVLSMSRDCKESSYSAFASVDALASKPILGSDGAASWQEFRSKTKVVSKGTAPHAPLKRADKLGTGFQNVNEERRHEEKMREEGNDAKMNSGYTTFKRKQSQADIEERKRRKMIEARIRPDKVKYYIAASTFEGWKEDYIFTTRERGTGYYWDGMDSVKKLRGEECHNTDADKIKVGAISMERNNEDREPKKKKKKSKKSKKESQTHQEVVDMNNPMEQILNAMRRRTEILARPPGYNSQTTQEAKAVLNGTLSSSKIESIRSIIDVETLKSQLALYDWEVATDPNSGKLYYFSRKSGERQWENPLTKLKGATKTSTEKDPLPDCTLLEGWRSAKDAVGKTYYYHRESGKTSWEKPTI